MTNLTRFDPTALSRALVGFDSIFDDMERRFATQLSTNYPPFNIAKLNENLYDISIAVTGFDKKEVSVTVEANELTIKGERVEKEETQQEPEYLHRGLALRNFERTFTLAEHMKVAKAEIKNGILTVTIEREVPEELQPRVIDVVEVK